MADYSAQLAPGLAISPAFGPAASPGSRREPSAARGARAAVVTTPSPRSPPPSRVVAAARGRFPGVDVRQALVERDPLRRAPSMRHSRSSSFTSWPTRSPASRDERVTAVGGLVAASVWDHAGERSPLAPSGSAARELDPDVQRRVDRRERRDGHLVASCSKRHGWPRARSHSRCLGSVLRVRRRGA